MNRKNRIGQMRSGCGLLRCPFQLTNRGLVVNVARKATSAGRLPPFIEIQLPMADENRVHERGEVAAAALKAAGAGRVLALSLARD